MCFSCRRHVEDAFTLVELLVVIAIISVLLSMLQPGLVRAREQARAMSCGANMRQIGMAFVTYPTENEGYYPLAKWQPDNFGYLINWRRVLFEHMRGEPLPKHWKMSMQEMTASSLYRLFWCPTYVGRYGRLDHKAGRGTSSINSYFDGGLDPPYEFPTLLGNQGTLEPLLVETAPVFASVPEAGAAHRFIRMVPSGIPGQSGNAQYRHSDRLNALFLDGSVRRLSMDEGAAVNSLCENPDNFE